MEPTRANGKTVLDIWYKIRFFYVPWGKYPIQTQDDKLNSQHEF